MLLPLLLALSASLPQASPPLPTLALDTFPAAAREAVQNELGRAAAKPGDPDAAGALGRTLQAWEQWESAHQAYARAQSLAPRRFEWLYLDAVVLQRLGRHREAAERLSAALSVDPTYLPARVKLAEALLEAGDAQKSRGLFEALAREPAAEPAARAGLARIAAAEGRHADAVAQFERAIELFPEMGAAHYGLARSYRGLGRQADAERALQQHARYGPRWPRIEDPVLEPIASLRDDARANLQRGVALAAAGEVEASIAAHEAALLRDPLLVQAHANLLSLYGRAGNWAKAENHYRAALEQNFKTADLHYDYGVVQALQQKWEEAAAAYGRAIGVNPLHANARNNLGQLLERRRDVEGAAAEYRQAVAAQPSFRLGRFNLGRMLLALGRPDEAAMEFVQLQQPVDADSPRYAFALSTAYVLAGKRPEGVRLAADAQRLAIEYGQTELAAAIAAELAKLK